MAADGSITRLIVLLKEGERAAAQPLGDAGFRRLVSRARAPLQGTPQDLADEEDVALRAFDRSCHRAARGRFPQLEDRDDLWQLLSVPTVRQAIGLVRHQGRTRRGGGRVASLADLAALDLDAVLGPEPTPELAAPMAEEYQGLLDRLGDETLRAVAQGKLEGWTNREIAARPGGIEATVERKPRSIRRLWSEKGRP
jgi:DNA-directed RNA polymerase specialized sigma24 family protein